MRILIIGAGAVGGYYGARLTAAGRDATFLVRPGRAAQLRSRGLEVISPCGDVTVQPRLLLASELHANPSPFDLIVLSTKAYSLADAIEDFAPAVGPNTAILPLLNGMRHLDILDARFGEHAVLGGATRIVADLDPEGRVLHLGELHDLVFGERNRRVTPRVLAIQALISGCRFEALLSPDVLAAMWTKWVLLASLAATNCLLRGSIGEVAEAPGGPETARRMIAECASVASANGYPQSPKFLDQHAARLTDPGSSLTASMFRDLQRGAPVESDQILGDLLARGAAHRVEAPLLRATHAQLSIYSTAPDGP